MIVKSLDGVDVEITHCDAGYAPGTLAKGVMLNTTACWCKAAGGKWIRSTHRSAMTTSGIVKKTNAKDLASALSGKEISDATAHSPDPNSSNV
jgi:hypothetical protein